MQIGKYLGQFFLPIPLSNVYQNIVTNVKIPDTIFKYLKKHTYESENTPDIFFAPTIFHIFKKHIYEYEKN